MLQFFDGFSFFQRLRAQAEHERLCSVRLLPWSDDTCGEEACSLATGLTTGLAFPFERERPSEKLEKNNLL